MGMRFELALLPHCGWGEGNIQSRHLVYNKFPLMDRAFRNFRITRESDNS